MQDYYENALGRAVHEEVAGVEPAYVLPQIQRRAHHRETWLLALVVTVAALGTLLVLVGLLLEWGQEQPAPTTPSSSTRPWEA
ncbi:hypothetical protein [Nonomuraea sp. NPDC049709]|uniref:hypothetical protein n=1 Tax=Nonomuraea sp. NPDC049709 TaxID=3154736 RepID=UPI00342C9ABB